MAGYKKITGPLPGLSALEGKRIAFTGTVSRIPWQHMIEITPEYPHGNYIDTGDDQVVVYTKKPVPCTGTVEVAGTVIRITGTSKRPGSTEEYTEYQVRADWLKCR